MRRRRRRAEDGVVKFLHIFVLGIAHRLVLDLDLAVFPEDPDAVFVAMRRNHVTTQIGSVAKVLGADLTVETVLVVGRHHVTAEVGRVRKLLAAFAGRGGGGGKA